MTSAAVGSHTYHLEIAYRQPAGVSRPSIEVTDSTGAPLRINGVVVTLEPATCGPPCPPAADCPTIAGQTWQYWRSTQLLTPSNGRVPFHVNFHWPPGSCDALHGHQTSLWVSDDRGRVHGSTVTPLCEERLFTVRGEVPNLPGWAMAALALLLGGAGWVVLRGRVGKTLA